LTVGRMIIGPFRLSSSYGQPIEGYCLGYVTMLHQL